MNLVTLQDERLLAWAEEKLETQWDRKGVRWLSGVDSAIRFVVVYSRFYEQECWMSIATDGSRTWATKRSLRAIFALPFGQWGLRRVTFLVRADNEKSLKMVRQAGGEQEGRARKLFKDDADGIFFGMLREECKWVSGTDF